MKNKALFSVIFIVDFTAAKGFPVNLLWLLDSVWLFS